MQSIIDTVSDRGERPAWVRFERVAVENKAETLKQGKWVGTDVDIVHITPPYGKDEVDKKATAWIEQMNMQVIQQKMRPDWRDRYLAEYEAWKQGQELPVNGTPVLGWGVISPAQQKALIANRIVTVEDVAHMNDEGIKAVGMGAVTIKQKAVAWLAQVGDKGPLTIKMAAMEDENRTKGIEIDTLKRQVEELTAMVKASMNAPLPMHSVVMSNTNQITAADLMDDEPEPRLIEMTPVAVPAVTEQAIANPVKRHRRTKAEMDAARAAQMIPVGAQEI